MLKIQHGAFCVPAPEKPLSVWYYGQMDENLRRWANGPECSVAEAARILKVSRETVRRMILRGDLYAGPAVPGGVKKLLWEGQVRDMAAAARAEAIQRGKMMQSTFNFF